MRDFKDLRIDRRQALAGLGAWSAAAWLPQASPKLPESQRTLVLLQLAGGNDGLSMVVPHGDDLYHSARPNLRHAPDTVLRIDDYRGFHPALKNLRDLHAQGRLALLEGVGYPNPIRSHFKSFDVWHAGDPRGRALPSGWIGRLCDHAFANDRNPNLVVHVGGTPPYSLHSVSHPPAAFVTPNGYRWAGDQEEQAAYASAGMEGLEKLKQERAARAAEGESNLEFLRKVVDDGQNSSAAIRRACARYKPAAAYPDEAFARSLRDVAALVHGGLGTRVFSVELGGFDTHTDQRNRHDQLMRRLDAGLGSLCEDLARSEPGRNALIVVFSEFGRRVKENGSRGSDHGAAGPMLVLGAGVKGGRYGSHPALGDLDDGDLKHKLDFRSVYATVLERWFATDAARVLGSRHPQLDFV